MRRILCNGMSSMIAVALFATVPAVAAEWPSWRGPDQNGVSHETGLVSSWSLDGENLIWRDDFIGRSTPVVYDGQVCVMGRTDDSRSTRQEVVACFDAETGAKRWEHRYNVYNTTVPFQRVGWASPVADPETGNLYTQGVAGQFYAFDRDGKVLWSYSLGEDFGQASGYGGRTNTPVVDGDLVLLSLINIGWGDQGPPRPRYIAFDKRTGQPVWVSSPGRQPEDLNTQSVPVTATIGGVRQLINGAADGWIYGLKATTGEKIWEFNLSKRGINANVLVDGETIYAGHSEENVDEPVMGRVVAFSAKGKGDLTPSAEKWRHDDVAMGFSSPALLDGTLYVVDNSANLLALDAATGATRWTYSIGTVGKASPVLADGKLYIGEVNGRFQILKISPTGAKELDLEELTVANGRYAEIYGSAAVAYGRIYFTAESGLYCLGDKSKPFRVTKDPAPAQDPAMGPGEGPATWLQALPAEALLRPGEKLALRARTFDSRGRLIGEVPAEWSLEGLAGKIDGSGSFEPASDKPFQAGQVVAKSGDLEAKARVRVIADPPWDITFDAMPEGRAPSYWIAGGRPWQIRKVDGDNVLVKIKRDTGLLRNATYIGPSSMRDYTIQADVMGHRSGRRLTDIGLIANGYTLDMQGNQQKLEVRSWASTLRMAESVDFAWEPEVWYTMKLKVRPGPGKAIIEGKVWPRGQDEPAQWTIHVEDALPISNGSPGLIGYSPADIYYDNIKVAVN